VPTVEYESQRVLKALKSLPSWKKERIIHEIDDSLSKLTPKSKGVVFIKNSNSYRIRIGDYRVFYQRNGDVVTVTNIRPRKDSYRTRQ
jgi:mRNA-degrading endonuclease RelE of RelBE toxin-antitoxin system